MINRKLLKLIIITLALLTAAMSLSVMRGWLIKDSAIVQIQPGFAPMQFNTALCFALAAFSLLFIHTKRNGYSFLLAAACLIISAASGAQYLLNINLGLDTLFAEPFVTDRSPAPGRMSPMTSLNFILLSCGLLLSSKSLKIDKNHFLPIILGAIIMAGAVTALLSYGTGMDDKLLWAKFTLMAIHTSVGFLLLSVSLILTAVQNSEIENFYEIPFLAHIAGAATLLFTVLMWLSIESTTTLHIQSLLDKHDEDLGGDIRTYLELESRAIKRMAIRLGLNVDSDELLFKRDVEAYLEDFPDLIGMAWIGRSGNFLQVVKQDSESTKDYGTSFKQNLDYSRTSLEPRYRLVQVENNGSFISITTPVIHQNQATGFLVALTDIRVLFKEVLANRPYPEYVTSLYVGGDLFIEESEALDPRWESRSQFPMTDIEIDVVAHASPDLVQSWQIYVPVVFLFVGIFMSVLVTIVLKLFQSTRTMTVALSQVNAQLHDSLREVESSKNELEIKSRALEQSNKDLENFASIAAHDLNEPLRKISIFGERILTNSAENLDEKGKNYLDVMINGATRMQTLLNSLLAYSRVTTKGGEFSSTDLNAVLQDVQADLEELIAENNVEIILNNLPTINADYTQMRQLFQNLIANSIRYQKPDAIPKIEISHDADTSPDNRLRVIVKDNGIGFDQDNADKIFEVFKRLHSRSEYPGTGMGLAVCKRIMERHKGEISAQGEQDKGASFILDFPKY